MKKWYETLTEEELQFIKQMVNVDFKLSKLSVKTGLLYFLLRKRIQKIKKKLNSNMKQKSEFKEYLEFLVDEDILTSLIAEVLYSKHKKQLEE